MGKLELLRQMLGAPALGGREASLAVIIGGDGKILRIDKEVNPSTAGGDLIAHMQDLGLAN